MRSKTVCFIQIIEPQEPTEKTLRMIANFIHSNKLLTDYGGLIATPSKGYIIFNTRLTALMQEPVRRILQGHTPSHIDVSMRYCKDILDLKDLTDLPSPRVRYLYHQILNH